MPGRAQSGAHRTVGPGQRAEAGNVKRPSPASMQRRAVSIWALPGRRLAVGTLVAALVLTGAFVLGSVDQSNLALAEMGFDPDRAQLITALLIGAVMAAGSIMAGGRIAGATLLGCLGSAALFGPTYVRETQAAVASTGAAGTFDLEGWLVTVLALVVSGLVSGWAGAALATVARPAIADTIRAAVSIVGRRRVEGPAARRVAGMAIVVVLLFVTLPVFSDIVNYTPDSRMLHGRPPLIGLGGPDLTPPPISTDTPGPSPGATPSILPSASLSADPSSSQSAGPSPSPVDPHPWLAWPHSGLGNVVSVALPGPWKSYSPKGSRRYPVLYEAPYAWSHWDDATNISGALYTLITKGSMPPAIVVAMSTAGGAYTDSECTDSYDGREWFDTYVAKTVVPWIDSHYLTIPTASARGILGASQGGYCAAALAVRHPDVFGTSLVFSGYFHAGKVGPPSTLPFGTDEEFINAASPDVVIFRLPPDARAKLYYVIVAQLGQGLYGEEAVRFADLLDKTGIPHMVIDSQIPHGWAQLRTGFSYAMEVWAARMVSTGVFDSAEGGTRP
jgi:esterase/lipase superfamily enzyme